MEDHERMFARRAFDMLHDVDHIDRTDAILRIPNAVEFPGARWPGYLGSKFRVGSGVLAIANVHRELRSGRLKADPPISELRGLEFLFLQALRQVESLPNLSRSTGLRRLWIETMKGITDLSPIRDAPSLRHLAVIDMAHLQPEAFAPVAEHPTLQSMRFGLGSTRKNDAVAALVNLPRKGDWTKPFAF
jgi:hypothetical protein